MRSLLKGLAAFAAAALFVPGSAGAQHHMGGGMMHQWHGGSFHGGMGNFHGNFGGNFHRNFHGNFRNFHNFRGFNRGFRGRTVIVPGWGWGWGWGWAPAYGYYGDYYDPCPSWWWDGWAWRCDW